MTSQSVTDLLARVVPDVVEQQILGCVTTGPVRWPEYRAKVPSGSVLDLASVVLRQGLDWRLAPFTLRQGDRSAYVESLNSVPR